MRTVPTPREHCPRCGYAMECASGAGHGRTPGPGALSLCLKCGDLAVFDEGMRRRPPTPEELAQIRVSDAWPRIREVRRGIALLWGGTN